MIDWKVENNDLVTNPDGSYVVVDLISQAVYMTFATWLRSWFFDLDFGVDYLNLKGTLSIEQVNLKIQTMILSIDGVTGINSFVSEYEGTNRFYKFAVDYSTTQSPSNILTNPVIQ